MSNSLIPSLIVSEALTPGPVTPITTAEVLMAVRRMKNGKAPGPDNMPADAWKLMGQNGAEILAIIFNCIIKDG